MNGALLINKHPGISSFGIIDELQKQLIAGGPKGPDARPALKRRDLPKLGHGGTLDPFATGLLIVCAGRAVKLARYFLGATKVYEGTIQFGQTTVPGDPTSPVTETSSVIPDSIDELRALARKLTLQPYLQTPPMHSAKKKDGKPLYELARQGIEVEREPKLCHLYEFEILTYEKPKATFRLVCSSGTYVRTLAQDFGRLLGTVALLETLDRTQAGIFRVANAWTLEQLAAGGDKPWHELGCWMPFDRLLEGYERAQATHEEAQALIQGRQNVLFNILKRAPAERRDPVVGQESCMAIYNDHRLVAVARCEQGVWGLERVFLPE
jgi:tRNA pseudouridine55 synthase